MESQELEEAIAACYCSRQRALLGLGGEVVDHDADCSSFWNDERSR